jgi:hypothetical protein
MPVSANKLVLGGTAIALATAPAMIANAAAEPPTPHALNTASSEAAQDNLTPSTLAARQQQPTKHDDQRQRRRYTTTTLLAVPPPRTTENEGQDDRGGGDDRNGDDDRTTTTGGSTSTTMGETSTTRDHTTTTRRGTTSTTGGSTTTTRGTTTTTRATTTTTAATTTTTTAPAFRLTQSFIATSIGRPIELDTTVFNDGASPTAITLTITLNSTGFNLPGFLNPQSKPAWLSCSPSEIQSPSTTGTFTCTGTVPAATSGVVVISSGSNIAGTAGQAVSSTGSLAPVGVHANAAAVLA